MAQPITFPSQSANFGLPLLFSGQAQKELFVNHAFSVIDAVLQLAVEDILSDPPASASTGEMYLVSVGPTGDWSGHDNQLAIRIVDSWQFVSPGLGTRIYNKAAGQVVLFNGSWIAANEPLAPSGGSVVDAEARTAISDLISALRDAGIFADNGQ